MGTETQKKGDRDSERGERGTGWGWGIEAQGRERKKKDRKRKGSDRGGKETEEGKKTRGRR